MLSSTFLPVLLSFLFTISTAQEAPQITAKLLFKLKEVMIPVRDGVHLQTVIPPRRDIAVSTASSDGWT